MSRRYTAIHETGHAFFFYFGGAPLAHIWIAPDPGMGPGEWEGEFNPGNIAGFDLMYAVLSAYGGELAEAKLRRQDATGGPIRFDHANDELPFINGQTTHPATGPFNPGKTSLAFIDARAVPPSVNFLLPVLFIVMSKVHILPQMRLPWQLAM